MFRTQQLIVIFCTFWITQCLGDYYSPIDYDSYHQVPVYYQYSWEVKDTPTGNDYRQEETRDGHLTTGLYQVVLPGGQRQTVNYRVDKDSGFMADISYQGDSNYFTFQSNYQPERKSYHQDPSQNFQKPPPSRSHSSFPSPYQYPQQEPSYDYSPVRKTESTSSYHSPDSSKKEYEPYPPRKIEQTYYDAPQPKYNHMESPYNKYSSTHPPSPPPRNNYQENSYYPHTGYSSSTAAIDVRTNDDIPTTTDSAITDDVQKVTRTKTNPLPNNYESKPDYSVPMYPIYLGDVYSARAKAGKSIPSPQSDYAVDEAGSTYIKPSAAYFVPERLGTYEIKHRKATARKPSQSDYQTPEAIIQFK